MSIRSLRKIIIPIVLLLLAGLLWFALQDKAQAPAVKFTTLSGQEIAMSDLRGKMVLVNFWATTCPGCIAEMPELIRTYQQYRNQGFEVVAVAMSYDPPAQVANYVEKNALPFPVALDLNGEIALAFNDVKLTPTAFIINQQGHIVSNIVGMLDFEALHSMLDQQLGRPI